MRLGGQGSIHGLMPIHVGMYIRLLEPLSLAHGLVKDTEGRIVDIVFDPLDEEKARDAGPGEQVHLTCVPVGIWVKVPKYARSDIADIGNEHLPEGETLEGAESIIFIEPRMSSFIFRRHWQVSRTGGGNEQTDPGVMHILRTHNHEVVPLSPQASQSPMAE